MRPYANLSGESAVVAYETDVDYIIVQFNSGRERFYKYTRTRVSASNLEQMKTLAQEGNGLNAFINKYVKHMYDSKW